jgi:putative peptidoglycan lipid II flippase
MVPDASTPFSEGSTTRPTIEEAEPATAAAAAPVAGEGAGLGAAAGPVSAATLASRVLGVVREQVMATLFGAGNAADAFNIAFRVPNLLRDLFAEGALSAAFVPTFTDTLHKQGRDEAWRLGAQVMNALAVVLSAVVIVAWFAAPALVRAMAPGFAAVPGKLELTIRLARVMLPFLVLVALAAAAMGMLNSMRRFGSAAMAPIWFNLGNIVVTVSLVPLMRALGAETVVAMAIGVLAGGLLQFVVQLPPLWRLGFRPSWPPALSHPGVKRIGVLMTPAAIGLSATQVNVVINSLLASMLGTGAVSWLAYAFRILFVPIGLFGVALATVSLPSLSRLASAGDIQGLKRTLHRAVRLTVALTLPAAFGLAALAQPLVALLYQHGRFTAVDTANTANALVAYTLGLAAYSGIKVLVPAFYALGDTRSPLVASFIAVGVNFGLNLLFMRFWGHVGLAFSTGLTAIFNFAQLWLWLSRKVGRLGGRRLLASASRAAAAAAIMGGVVGGVAWLAEPWWRGRLVGEAVIVLGCVALGAGLTLWLYRLFGVAELEDLLSAVRAVLGRLWRRPATPL